MDVSENAGYPFYWSLLRKNMLGKKKHTDGETDGWFNNIWIEWVKNVHGHVRFTLPAGNSCFQWRTKCAQTCSDKPNHPYRELYPVLSPWFTTRVSHQQWPEKSWCRDKRIATSERLNDHHLPNFLLIIFNVPQKRWVKWTIAPYYHIIT